MPFIYALQVLTAFLVGCCLFTLWVFARGLWRTRNRRMSGLASSSEGSVPIVPFDAKTIIPEILHLRTNFIHALHSRPHPLIHRTELLACARKGVAHSSYFRKSAALSVEQTLEVTDTQDREGMTHSSS
jgi:hypothetical protein